MLDIFNNDAFGAVQLTEAINERPFVPSFLRDMGLFNAYGVRTTSVALEQKGTSINLVSTTPRGAPPSERTRDQRTLRHLAVPHLAREATVYADQVQGVRSFGSENTLETVQGVVMEEVGLVGSEIDLTEENLMLGAIQGKLVDADGTTVISDFFTELGVSEPAAVNFALGTTTTKVRSKCTEIIRTMAKAMKAGGLQFRVMGLASDGFFDSLINHSDVKAAYERWQSGAALRQDYTYQSFPFAGIDFYNYRGSDDGAVAIPAGECRFFAIGVPNLFRVAYAPADRTMTVNTVGLPRYVLPNMEDTGNGRYQKFEVQANPLPYCTRPQTLLKGTAS